MDILIQEIKDHNMTKSIEKIIKDFSEDTKYLLKDNLIAEYLFGSTARGENIQYSDIDILIIVKQFNYKLTSFQKFWVPSWYASNISNNYLIKS